MPYCKFCNKEIFWMKEGRKNVPNNPDGSTHKCEEMQLTMKSTKTIELSSLSPEEIAKYEARINSGRKK